MDLGLSDEQRQRVASFASLLGQRSSTEQVRAAEPEGFDPALWRSLLDVGAVRPTPSPTDRCPHRHPRPR